MPRFSVIIVNYNGGDYLKRAVGSVFAQTLDDWELLLVDNGSSDNSLEGLPQEWLDDARIRLLKMDENLGFAVGNNRAAEAANGQWLALLNPDAEARENWLDQVAKAIDENPDYKLFGSTQLVMDNPELVDGAGDSWFIPGLPYRSFYRQKVEDLPPENREVLGPCGAAAIYERELFQTLGGFRAEYFCYVEDVEFAMRALLCGYPTLQIRQAELLHKGSAITGEASDFAVFHGTRNMVLTYWITMPGILFWLLLPVHGLLLLLLKFHQREAYRKGVKAAWEMRGYACKKRKHTQQQRTIPWWRFARYLTWSYFRFKRKR